MMEPFDNPNPDGAIIEGIVRREVPGHRADGSPTCVRGGRPQPRN
jgi:hypothetical protein